MNNSPYPLQYEPCVTCRHPRLDHREGKCLESGCACVSFLSTYSAQTIGSMCQKCNKRPQSGIWCESTLEFVHGMSQLWCQRCIVEAQLAHALKAAEGIPTLCQRLALLSKDAGE